MPLIFNNNKLFNNSYISQIRPIQKIFSTNHHPDTHTCFFLEEKKEQTLSFFTFSNFQNFQPLIITTHLNPTFLNLTKKGGSIKNCNAQYFQTFKFPHLTECKKKNSSLENPDRQFPTCLEKLRSGEEASFKHYKIQVDRLGREGSKEGVAKVLNEWGSWRMVTATGSWQNQVDCCNNRGSVLYRAYIVPH